MDTGLISSRYARALLLLVDETGGGEEVLAQTLTLSQALSSVPQLRRVLEGRGDLPVSGKLQLFESVLGGKKLAPELRQFITLVIRSGRVSLLRYIFSSFQRLWYRSRKIKLCHLTVTSPSRSLEEQLEEFVRKNTGCSVQMTTEVKPDIVGGFVFEVDDWLIDASVKTQLETIRRGFMEMNAAH
ncbi:MAG: ATP synthase F1 subunit delta [Bacteroidales bacterium]|nr:ATP synthase F1 subunit delta [Bacteroidales bacterium]MBQ9889043.1 ATP synthase F1 subunit delta [Bacteroidales bacterium]